MDVILMLYLEAGVTVQFIISNGLTMCASLPVIYISVQWHSSVMDFLVQ